MTAEPVTSSPLGLRGLSAVQLLQSLAEAAVVFDGGSGVVLLLNPAAERLFGRSAANVLGQRCEALLPGLSGALNDESRNLSESSSSLHLQAHHSEGTVSVEVTLTTIDRDGSAPTVLALVRAVGAQARHDDGERLAEALESAERRYRALTDFLLEAVFEADTVSDPDGVYT